MTTPSDADAALIAKLDAAELRIGLCEDANLAKLLDESGRTEEAARLRSEYGF